MIIPLLVLVQQQQYLKILWTQHDAVRHGFEVELVEGDRARAVNVQLLQFVFELNLQISLPIHLGHLVLRQAADRTGRNWLVTYVLAQSRRKAQLLCDDLRRLRHIHLEIAAWPVETAPREHIRLNIVHLEVRLVVVILDRTHIGEVFGRLRFHARRCDGSPRPEWGQHSAARLHRIALQ